MNYFIVSSHVHKLIACATSVHILSYTRDVARQLMYVFFFLSKLNYSLIISDRTETIYSKQLFIKHLPQVKHVRRTS